MPRGDIGFIPVAIDVDAVFAVLQYGEGGVRRIDLDEIIVIEMTNAQDHGAVGQTELRGAIIELKKCQTGFRAHAHGSRTDMQFSPRVAIGPTIVARGKRALRIRGYPVTLASPLTGNS